MIYVASRYSDPSPEVREQRFRETARAIAILLKWHPSEVYYSPIVHCHPISLEGDFEGGWDFWHRYCVQFLVHSKKMLVIITDGWEHSKGLMKELELAGSLNIPIAFCNPIRELEILTSK